MAISGKHKYTDINFEIKGKIGIIKACPLTATKKVLEAFHHH